MVERRKIFESPHRIPTKLRVRLGKDSLGERNGNTEIEVEREMEIEIGIESYSRFCPGKQDLMVGV